MTGLITGLVLAILALILLVAILADQIIRLNTREEQAQDAVHAKCLAHIADVTSKRIVAQSLREYARLWDSIEERANLQRLAREKYKPGGPAMPSIWLNYQADLLDPDTRQESE